MWNWRGVIGKATAADGTRTDVRGTIPDLDLIVCKDRGVILLFDRDQEAKEQVRLALNAFRRELERRGAQVSLFDWAGLEPTQAKGIDDLLAASGPDSVLKRLAEIWTRPPAQRRANPQGKPAPVVDAYSLYHQDLPEPVPVIGSLLYRGLTLLAGKAKVGKSWLILQLASNIATSRKLWDRFDIERPGSVLYFGLEEPQNRTRSRLRKLFGDADIALQNLVFAYSLPPLMEGGAAVLDATIAEHRPQLVVIDTLTALTRRGSRRDSNVFRAEYAEIDLLRKLAVKYETAVLIVHHLKKGLECGLDSIAGTGGLSAAADAIWILRRTSGGTAILETTGRDTQEQTLELRFDAGEPFGWKYLGEGADVRLSEERQDVLGLLSEEGQLKAKAIASTLRRPYESTRKLLQLMASDGQIVRLKGNLYALHTHSHSHSSQCEGEYV